MGWTCSELPRRNVCRQMGMPEGKEAFVIRAHEAGALHGQAGVRGPAWLHRPDDVNALVRHLWSHNVEKDHSMSVAGVTVDDLAAEYGTPLYVVDEDDFRSRAL